VETISIAISH